ncbi:Sigma factor binding protein 1- chloroplastic [Striga hermonthica]|uniref:Sigma factor binding protein 1- chloroplastic n=1 Tax=Striga hermonthica TaxID=68872 RepID=A0A9N7R469_STRHE|nr:Sigma factor binding protein 1- chloroplastic [Striga hermonthica]
MKRASKQQSPNSKAKKKGPLKVVYITNPIKFNATASEFRALVQELTGRDSDTPDSNGFGSGRDGSGKAAAVVEAKTGDDEFIEMAQNGPDQFGFGLSGPVQMVDSFQGLMASGFWNEGDDFDI